MMTQSSYTTRGLVITSCITFLLIFAGGLVTSTESGLAVPDWPLSYGTLFPPMVGGILYEHSHRMIAGVVLLLTLFLTLWINLRERRKDLRCLINTGMCLVLLQAVLGGLTVIFLLPKPISIFHAGLGQSFFCLMAGTAWISSPYWHCEHRIKNSDARLFQKMCLALTILLFVQLLLGAYVRHSDGEGVVWHILQAMVLLIISLAVAFRGYFNYRSFRKISAPAAAIGILVFIQVLLGLASLVLTTKERLPEAPVPMSEAIITTVHQSTGALILMISVLLTMNIYRFVEGHENIHSVSE